MELLLNWRGLRVDFRKTQGLFSENTRADRYPPGLTRARVFLAVGSRLGDPEHLGARAALCGRVAGVRQLGNPGPYLTWFWIRSGARSLANTTTGSAQGCSAVERPATAERGIATPVRHTTRNRGRKRGETGPACALPPREAAVVRRRCRTATPRRNSGGIVVVQIQLDGVRTPKSSCAQGRNRGRRARRSP